MISMRPDYYASSAASGPHFEALLTNFDIPLCATLLVNQPESEFLIKMPCGVEARKSP